ncbi:MAG TPA: M20/M25/M40 family metallo-hydrolase [Gemmatimonadales bacterium]|nr:M20/M25/M40 family metallo-hydrolase [Gemmatimonadales bacterium]
MSGDEAAVARLAEETARGWGLDVVRDDTGVKVELAGARPGPTLALVSHLDVVPPGEGWTRDPFTPVVEAGRLYGRGSGDAKASVAAMLCAARDLAARPGDLSGRLLVILGYGEETRHTSMPAAVASVGPIDAAVVGEPTNLDFAVAQRGLMMVDLVARGDQRHAAYAATGEAVNAVTILARDLLALEALCRDRPHPRLGHPTITATMLQAGVSRNVTPPVARAVLDIRSTPAWPHEAIAAELRRGLRSEVVVTSDRLVPCEAPAGSRLLAAAERVRPGARHYGSPTCSDWVFLRHADAFKCGPGTSRRSHAPDECVELDEVSAARAFYAALAREYLA